MDQNRLHEVLSIAQKNNLSVLVITDGQEEFDPALLDKFQIQIDLTKENK